MKRRTGVYPQFRGIAGLALVGFVLAACGSSSATSTATVSGGAGTPVATSTPPPAATATATVAASSSSAATSANSSGATGVPTSIDPCTLVTAQEASQLASASFGAGKETITSGNGKVCTYGYQTLNVFEVIVGQAPNAATAQAGKASAQAQIEAAAGKGVQFTELPNFADGAAYTTGSYSISGQKFNIAAFYALKGTIFFGFSDLALGTPSLTAAAMQAQAQIVLGRLP